MFYDGIGHFEAVTSVSQAPLPSPPPPQPPPPPPPQQHQHQHQQLQQQQQPRAKEATVPPPIVVYRAALASRGAALRAREGGEPIAMQQEMALATCRSRARSFGADGQALPCFMCGGCFSRLKTHWASRRAGNSGAPTGSACSRAWHADEPLPLAAAFVGPPPVPDEAPAGDDMDASGGDDGDGGGAGAGNGTGDGAGTNDPDASPSDMDATDGGSQGDGGSPGGSPAGSKELSTDDMPWDFALELLQGGTLTALPRVHTVKDIPHGSRRRVTKALELCLTRLAADAHDKAANTVY
jgi:hypothetical protein